MVVIVSGPYSYERTSFDSNVYFLTCLGISGQDFIGQNGESFKKGAEIPKIFQQAVKANTLQIYLEHTELLITEWQTRQIINLDRGITQLTDFKFYIHIQMDTILLGRY